MDLAHKKARNLTKNQYALEGIIFHQPLLYISRFYTKPPYQSNPTTHTSSYLVPTAFCI